MFLTSVSTFAFSLAKLLLLPTAIVTAGSSSSLQGRNVGGGDLLVAPARVVFLGSTRTVDVNLLNIGTHTATYRISLIHERMNADGSLMEIETPGAGEHFADDLVRFTPRQVVLQPNVSQLVRIQLREPGDLEAGEYRSHLLFRAIPDVVANDLNPNLALASDVSATGISMQLSPVYGVSIPLIVRRGKTEAKVGMKDLRLSKNTEGNQVVTGTLTRSGNQSTYGELYLAYTPVGGKSVVIGTLGGVAVYSPNTDRNFSIQVALPIGVSLRGGNIKVVYRGSAAEDAKLITEGILDLS